MEKKSYKQWFIRMARVNKLLLALCELAVGVVLLIDPVGFSEVIIKGIGVALVVFGVLSSIQYFKTSPEMAAQEQNLTIGLLEIMGGLFCLIKSSWFMVTFPLLTVIYGVITLVTGAAKVQWAADLFRENAAKWFLAALSAIISLVCGIIILCNPFASTTVLWTFIAISLIVEAVFDVIGAIFARADQFSL